MDPIIRAAPVSSTARQLRRLPERPVAAPAPVPAPASAPAASTMAPPMPATAFGIAPPPAVDVQSPRVAELEAALAERDAEIATLRETMHRAHVDLVDAHSDAEQRGYAAGEEKGDRVAREQLQVQIDRLKTLVFQIGQARTQVMADAEDTLVDIAYAAICRVIGEEGASRDTIVRMVRNTAAATRERDQLVVRLHPDDAALLRLEENPLEGDTRISADPGIALGGCIVDSATGSLDARFETQLALLAQALKSVRAGRHIDEDAV